MNMRVAITFGLLFSVIGTPAVHAQITLDHTQERLIRLKAMDVYFEMEENRRVNHSIPNMLVLFESEGTEVPNDFPPVCDQIEDNNRSRYGEPMIIRDYAEKMESEKTFSEVEYNLLDLGNLTLKEGGGTIEITFEKKVLLRKTCSETSAFPSGMRARQTAVIAFRLSNNKVDPESFRIRSIRMEGEAEPTSNTYLLEKGKNGITPTNNAVLRFTDGPDVESNRKGILPDRAIVNVDDFKPDHFWQFMTDKGSGKIQQKISEIRKCDCEGKPYVLYQRNNRLDAGVLIGSPNGTIRDGWSNAELLGIESSSISLSTKWTRYIGSAENRTRKLFSLSGQMVSESWNVVGTSEFSLEYDAIDPDGDSYIRNSTIQNFSESLTRQYSIVSLEAGLAYAPKVDAVSGLLLELRVGADVAYVLKSEYEASAEGTFSGKYPQLFGVVMAENGIYDFGSYSLSGSGNSTLGDYGLGGHISGGISWRPTGKALGVACSGQYGWIQWNNDSRIDYISRNPEELESAFARSNSISRSLFGIYPSIFFQF